MLYITPTVMSIVLNRGKDNLDFTEEFNFELDLDIKNIFIIKDITMGNII
jgi:hypothetical protein